MLFWSFWNAWAKSVIKVFLYNCLTRPRSQPAAFTSESNDSIYCVSSAHSEAQVIFHIWKLLYSVAYPYLVPVYQEVTILFSLTRWMETVLVRKCFMRYSNFGWKPGLWFYPSEDIKHVWHFEPILEERILFSFFTHLLVTRHISEWVCCIGNDLKVW